MSFSICLMISWMDEGVAIPPCCRDFIIQPESVPQTVEVPGAASALHVIEVPDPPRLNASDAGVVPGVVDVQHVCRDVSVPVPGK